MSTQLSRDHLGLPPPVELDSLHPGASVGRVSTGSIGFHGFANAADAMRAAGAAHRTLSEWLVRRDGTRRITTDAMEPITLADDGETILAGARPIGTLIGPGEGSRGGPDTFGFKVRVPAPADDAERMRDAASVVFHALRASGARWDAERSDGDVASRDRSRVPPASPVLDAARGTSTRRGVDRHLVASASAAVVIAALLSFPRWVPGATLLATLVGLGLALVALVAFAVTIRLDMLDVERDDAAMPASRAPRGREAPTTFAAPFAPQLTAYHSTRRFR